MKRVLFLVPSLGMGGMERVLVNYANLFARRGYDVTVYNLSYSSETISSGFDESVHYYSGYIPVKSVMSCGFGNLFKGCFRLLPFEKWISFHSDKYLHKKYIKNDFDTEIAFYGEIPSKIVAGCNKDITKNAAFIHSTDLKEYYKKNPKSLKSAKKYYSEISNIICVSESVKRQFEEVFGKRSGLHTVNNPNDTKRIRKLGNDENVPAKTNFTFVNVSRIYDHAKGFMRLLSVCKRLNDDGFDYSLWIVGDGIDYEKVKSRADELGVKNVTFFGQQENPYKYMKNADMYICSSYYEGFSMTVSEAITLGIPVLTTNVSGAYEMFDDGKFGFVVDNSEGAIYDGMKKILSDKALYEHYKTKAEERKDYLSEEAVMDKLVKIIDGE